MKITDVSVVVHERTLPVGMPLPPMEIAVLRIHTDDGVEGNTFISPPGPNVTEQILKHVKPLLLGRDPLDIGAIWHELWARRRGMHSTVQGYIDVALWDIAGKAAGLPIYPLQADDLYGYRRLKQQLSIPIMATEMTEGGVYALAPWLVQQATDFLRGDVVIKGGITGMMKIAHLAEAFQMNCELHDAYNALNNVATLHVAMAIRNCEYYEVLVIHPPGEYDTTHFSYGLTEPIEIDTMGNSHAPTRPGLGYDIDWDLINATQHGELR